MFSRIYNTWQLVRGSLWFAPALICLCYFIGTIGLYWTEQHYLEYFQNIDILYNGSVEEARSVITILLSAMITMATLMISITMVVLSLSASQLGPRLIRSFMRDSETQIHIGVFFGTVVACFVLTGILHDDSLANATPRLTISAVFIACFANLFGLLAFVHHIARSSIADNVVTRVSAELFSAIKRICQPRENQVKTNPIAADTPKEFQSDNEHAYFSESGYVQFIDYPKLIAIAAEKDIYIRIQLKAGHYLVAGEDGVRLYPQSRIDRDIKESVVDCFVLGDTRTPTQDMEYSIRHLVEIALRALSPGINDSFTAMTVLDRLSSALAILFENDIHPNIFKDDNDVIRVIGRQSDEYDIVLGAFSQIRNAGQNKPDILHHIIRRIKTLRSLPDSNDARPALDRQLRYIRDHIHEHFSNTLEGEELSSALNEAMSFNQ